MEGAELVEAAATFAGRAHAGQIDKSGAPYIAHPARVAARIDGDDVAQAAAWLHDVVEDTGTTLDDLRAAGFPAAVVDAVGVLTCADGEDRAAYYARVGANPVARTVKLADIADNSDPARLARLDPATRTRLEAKYAAARVALGAPSAVRPQARVGG